MSYEFQVSACCSPFALEMDHRDRKSVMWLLGILASIFVSVHCQQDGWKMTDRFYGFRYEVFEKDGASADSMIEALSSKASESKCFGWAQKVPEKETVVGEIRCLKRTGIKFKEWLEAYDDNFKQILVYGDTKIRLHFTYFKVLEESRNTCFLEPPHSCDDLPDLSSTPTEGDSSDEL